MNREYLETLAAQNLMAEILADPGVPACVTSSFQAEDMVVVDLARRVRPDIPVLFLETGYHFPETLAYRDAMASAWNLNVVNLAADLPVTEHERQFGILNQTDPTRCCEMRKVGPLLRGLEPYEIWLTGLRREQSPTRANLKKVESHTLPVGKSLWKVSVLADWTNRDVWAYAKEHGLPLLPLYEQGYTSIGCAPCTAKPSDPENARSGRWGGKKLECGIHTFSASR